MADSFYLVLVELLGWGDLSLIGLKNTECEIIWLGLGQSVISTQCHVEVMLMCRPFDVKFWGLSNYISINLFLSMYK